VINGCQPRGLPGFEGWPTLRQVISTLGKRQWFARNPPRLNGERFTTLFGTNFVLPDKPFGSFFPLESPEGRAIVDGLRHAEPGQGELFPR
jgi:hypothetical protein